jgi:hypothetical protein
LNPATSTNFNFNLNKMRLIPRKSTIAVKAAKGATNLFSQAQKKLEKSTEKAREAMSENTAKVNALNKENGEMYALINSNAVASNNIDKFLTSPILTKDEQEEDLV